MKVIMRATYDTVEWTTTDESDPIEGGGFTDPSNPWGGFKAEIPDGLVGDAFVVWRDENVETVEFDNLWDAASFVADFPGGVWDYRESANSTEASGVEMSVTLHVESHQPAVFALARFLDNYKGEFIDNLREVHFMTTDYSDLPADVQAMIDEVNNGATPLALGVGQTGDRVFDNGEFRVWRERVGPADGYFGPTATVEQLVDGRWEDIT